MVAANVVNNNDRDHYSAKLPIFDGEKFYYQKHKIEILVLGYDVDLQDLVVDGYIHPVNDEGNTLARSAMCDQHKKDFKNHHKAITILLNVISYMEYEKITNKDSTKSIFDSLRINHEGNAQVKETKVLVLIQKYETFKMEDDEKVETMLSRFQMLVARLKVLDKWYSIVDHVKKIIISLPKKWRHMVTALKLANDLNNISLEELVSFLRSHQIELEEYEPRKRGKYIALKSKPEKIRAYQAGEESEGYDKESDDDDDLSLISKRVNRVWKHRQSG